MYAPGFLPPGTGPFSVLSLPFPTFVSQKMCHRELQVFTVHSSFGADREICHTPLDRPLPAGVVPPLPRTTSQTLTSAQ